MKKAGSTFSSFSSWRAHREGLPKPQLVFFVPTMGALHQGHASLIKSARDKAPEGAEVVVSVFVNPTQFNDAADFEAYPSTADSDVQLAISSGASSLVFPGANEMYPKGVPDEAEPTDYGTLTRLWEGEHRPGHFDGVVAVVRSLFHQVKPDWAFFGEKDWQQLAVIRRLAKEEFPKVRIQPVKTVREKDGLAMSSRNVRLPSDQREGASKLYDSLVKLAGLGQTKVELDRSRRHLEGLGFDVEYLAFVDESSMCEVDHGGTGKRVIVAANFAGVRLIDNVPSEG